MFCAIFGFWCPQVDAFYYPDRNDLSVYETFVDVGSVESCRDVVFAAAAGKGDPNLERGDYECGVGPTGDEFGGMKVYEETVE
ncbi:MAG: hypothetical protein ABI459_08890 [Deltaproteobacteria bacterium]